MGRIETAGRAERSAWWAGADSCCRDALIALAIPLCRIVLARHGTFCADKFGVENDRDLNVVRIDYQTSIE